MRLVESENGKGFFLPDGNTSKEVDAMVAIAEVLIAILDEMVLARNEMTLTREKLEEIYNHIKDYAI